MPKILLLVSIALISVSAVLGFLTKGKIGDLNQSVKQAGETASAASAKASKAEADAKKSQEEANAAKDEAKKAGDELTAVKTEAEKSKGQIGELETQIKAKDAEIASLKGQPTPQGETPGPTDELVKLQTELKDAQTKLAEKDQLVASLTAKANEAENKARVLAEKEDKRQRQFMAKGLEGQILAVNQAWNFVVLNIGDRQGVVMGSQMIVKRGGQMIGKVKITSVEPSTSIADVIPESVPRGAHVVPGDSVVYTGS